jgi:hypothetical protein
MTRKKFKTKKELESPQWTEQERIEMRAKNTLGDSFGFYHMPQFENMDDFQERMIGILMSHERQITLQYQKSFRFKLPSPADLRSIDKNAPHDYKCGWESGAQYMINLNRI